MPTPVTDPDLLQKLDGRSPVSDPDLLKKLNGDSQEKPVSLWESIKQNFSKLGPSMEEGLIPAATQGVSPHLSKGYLGPATYGEDGEVFYKDANGNPVPTDTSKHVLQNGEVFARPAEEKSVNVGGINLPLMSESNPLVGISRVLSPGLVTGPLARTPGLAKGLIERRLTEAGAPLRESAAPIAEAAAPAAEAAAPGIVTAATPGQATRAEIEAASGRLRDYGTPVDMGAGLASDSPLVQMGTGLLKNVPILGSPIVQGVEKTIQQLGEATQGVANKLAGGAALSREGAGSLGKDVLADWIGPTSKGQLDTAFDSLVPVMDPNVRRPLSNTADAVAKMEEARKNAGIPDPSPMVRLVSDAIKNPAADQLAALTAQLGGTPRAAEMAAKALEKAGVPTGGLDFKGTKELRTYVRRNATGAPEDMQAINEALTRDLAETARAAGGTTGEALWQKVNMEAAQTLERRKELKKIVGLNSDAPPALVLERIMNAAKDSSKANTDLLMKARGHIGADWNKVVSASTQELGITPKGIWQPEKFIRDWDALTDTGKSALYGTGAHRQALEDIAIHSNRWPQLQKYQNPPGTARTLLGGYGIVHAVAHPLAALAAAIEPTTMAAGGAVYMGARRLARSVTPPVAVPQVLANPATAASTAAWTRAYERVARTPTPAALAQFTLQSRNLANTINSQFGTNLSSDDFKKALQPKQ